MLRDLVRLAHFSTPPSFFFLESSAYIEDNALSNHGGVALSCIYVFCGCVMNCVFFVWGV